MTTGFQPDQEDVLTLWAGVLFDPVHALLPVSCCSSGRRPITSGPSSPASSEQHLPLHTEGPGRCFEELPSDFRRDPAAIEAYVGNVSLKPQVSCQRVKDAMEALKKKPAKATTHSGAVGIFSCAWLWSKRFNTRTVEESSVGGSKHDGKINMSGCDSRVLLFVSLCMSVERLESKEQRCSSRRM